MIDWNKPIEIDVDFLHFPSSVGIWKRPIQLCHNKKTNRYIITYSVKGIAGEWDVSVDQDGYFFDRKIIRNSLGKKMVKKKEQ